MMGTESNSEQKSSRWWEVMVILIAFGLWVWMFRSYLTGRILLFDDAISYYDHVKFYLDNIRRGVFPLWDPLWFCGAANNFFLQRMGCFNPFLLVTNLFYAVGIPYLNSYLIYLSLYYLLGCVGFYLLAKEILAHKVSAFASFALLFFSSLGTRLFDAYLVLMFTPVVWFFYFLVVFCRRPQRWTCLGMAACVLIISTTYIPFYFLLVVCTFLIFYAFFYGSTLPGIFKQSIGFAGKNKLLVLICVAALLTSLVPGYLFFKASQGGGEFVMPSRSANQAAAVGSVLAVQRQDTNSSWSIMEEIFFAGYYCTDIRQIKFAILYIPLLAYIIFFLGFFNRINRRSLFFYSWAVGLFLICSPAVSPVYSFLYKYVFFFKYFRNLHFLLWIAFVPMFCLFIGDQLKSLLTLKILDDRVRWLAFLTVTLVHGGLLWWIERHQLPLATTYAAIGLSYLFFVACIFLSIQRRVAIAVVLLLAAVAVEPLEVYSYLSRNAGKADQTSLDYNFISLDFFYTRFGNDIDMALSDYPYEEMDFSKGRKRFVLPASNIYYSSSWYSYLASHIDYDILRKYRKHKFVLYDQVEPLDESKMDVLSFETSLAENRNIAFVGTADPDVLAPRSQDHRSYYAQLIEGESESFKVIAFNVNRVKIKVNFAEPKFLVYNDNFHTQWKAKIDGKQENVIRSNIAFKGLWVPAGAHTVEFSFGSTRLWLIYLSMFVMINGVLVWAVIERLRESRRRGAHD